MTKLLQCLRDGLVRRDYAASQEDESMPEDENLSLEFKTRPNDRLGAASKAMSTRMLRRTVSVSAPGLVGGSLGHMDRD